jgi:hypothetical protein
MADEAGVVIKLFSRSAQLPQKEREYKVKSCPRLGGLYL